MFYLDSSLFLTFPRSWRATPGRGWKTKGRRILTSSFPDAHSRRTARVSTSPTSLQQLLVLYHYPRGSHIVAVSYLCVYDVVILLPLKVSVPCIYCNKGIRTLFELLMLFTSLQKGEDPFRWRWTNAGATSLHQDRQQTFKGGGVRCLMCDVTL